MAEYNQFISFSCFKSITGHQGDSAHCNYSGTQADGTATVLNAAHHCSRGTRENSGESCIDY